MPEFIIIIIGCVLIAGIGLVYFKLHNAGKPDIESQTEILKRQVEELATGKRVAEERASMFQEQIGNLNLQVAEKDNTILALNRRVSETTTESRNLVEKLAEQKAEVEKLQEKFSTEFRNLANEILEEKTLKFTEQNKTKLEEILKPLGEKSGISRKE